VCVRACMRCNPWLLCLFVCVQLLIDHEEAVAPQRDDPLHLILKDLGPSPSIESLIGKGYSTSESHNNQTRFHSSTVQLKYILAVKGMPKRPAEGVTVQRTSYFMHKCSAILVELNRFRSSVESSNSRRAGGVRETIPGEDREDLIAQAGKQEIPLTLTNKFESLAESDSMDSKALFVRFVCVCGVIICVLNNFFHVVFGRRVGVWESLVMHACPGFWDKWREGI